MKLDDILATLNESILLHSNGDKQLAAKVLKEIQAAAAEEKEERAAAKGPKLKNQHVLIVSDPNGILSGTHLVGWALTIEEEAAPQAALDRVKLAIKGYNESRKGRKHPAKTLGEGIEATPRKFYKTSNPAEKTLVKNKVPVLVIASDGTL